MMPPSRQNEIGESRRDIRLESERGVLRGLGDGHWHALSLSLRCYELGGLLSFATCDRPSIERSLATGTAVEEVRTRPSRCVRRGWYLLLILAVRRDAAAAALQPRSAPALSACRSSIGISSHGCSRRPRLARHRRRFDARRPRCLAPPSFSPSPSRRNLARLFGRLAGAAPTSRPRAVGARRPQLRHDRLVVFARRRSLHGLYVHRRPGARLRHRRVGFLRGALCDDRLSHRAGRAFAILDASRARAATSPPPTSSATGTTIARLEIAIALTGVVAAHAVHRAAARRDARGASGQFGALGAAGRAARR